MLAHGRTLAIALVLTTATATAAPLQRDETVMLLPEVAEARPDGSLSLTVSAWVYEVEPRRGAAWLFARWLGVDLDALDAAERGNFERRTALFRFDSERGKRLRVRTVDGREHRLPATDRHGRVTADLPVRAAPPAQSSWVAFGIVAPAGDPRRFEGRALVVPVTGLSIVSDIDDTLKVSEVHDRRRLLLNTFVHPWRPVPGMAAILRILAGSHADNRVHYLSNSPRQLLPELQAFLDREGFPAGSLHLRDVRVREEVFTRIDTGRRHKRARLRELIARFPQRRFLLVGDDGEADPEIYGAIARDHPGHVAGIAIRRTGDPADDDAPAARERFAAAFAGLPPDLWQLFRDGDDWPR